MKILHVVPTYLPATRYGGPIYAVHGLCRALVSLGHEVHVFTTNVDGPGQSDVPLASVVDLEGVKVHYFSSPLRRIYWSPAMSRAFESIAAFDLAHLHSVFLFPTSAAARAARRGRIPYVISPRGMLVPDLIQRKSRLAKSLWLRFFERRNFAGAAAIHFTSRREWDDAARLTLPLPAPFVVPNGIDLSPADVAGGDDHTVLALGRVTWKKGLDRLIEALADVPGARLVVAGNDEEDCVPKLTRLATTLGIGDRVTFVGPVEGKRKQDLLSGAAILALPSLSENFGNVVLEAMAASTPVLVTPEVGLSDDVARAGAGIVTGGTPTEIAAAIRTALADRPGRLRMGEAGRRAVEEKFAWPRVARDMTDHYEQLRR